MTADRLIQAIGNVSDRYVLEYNPAAPEKNIRIQWKPKWFIAACLTFAVIVTALILPSVSEQDLPGEYKAYHFSSCEEFSSVVPDIQIVENLSQFDGVELIIYGTYRDITNEDSTKAENYAWFDITVKSGDRLTATLKLTLDGAGEAELRRINSALTSETDINGVPVYYTYNHDGECWDAVAVADEIRCDIQFYSAGENEFLEFLTALLQ